MREELSKHIISFGGYTSLDDASFIIAFDEGADAQISDEDVNEPFHKYFVEASFAAIIFVFVHVGDRNCPVGQAQVCLLLNAHVV